MPIHTDAKINFPTSIWNMHQKTSMWQKQKLSAINYRLYQGPSWTMLLSNLIRCNCANAIWSKGASKQSSIEPPLWHQYDSYPPMKNDSPPSKKAPWYSSVTVLPESFFSTLSLICSAVPVVLAAQLYPSVRLLWMYRKKPLLKLTEGLSKQIMLRSHFAVGSDIEALQGKNKPSLCKKMHKQQQPVPIYFYKYGQKYWSSSR